MASDYGLNFGFRRSDESVRVSEGRFRTPATGSPLLIGTAVQIDPANAGFVKPCAASAPIVPGVAGILVQEEAHWGSIYGQDVSLYDSYNLGVAKLNCLSVITTGAGTKVWFRNTTGATRADGRVTPSVTIVNTASVSLGDSLGWNGTVWAKVTDLTTAWMTVTFINSSSGLVEGVLTK
jgi:hypothetical protein